MTTSDAIAQLERNNDDLVLVRVGGSVAVERFDGQELSWVERNLAMQAALDKAKELSGTGGKS